MTTYDLEARESVAGDLGLLIATWLDSTREWQESLEQPSPEAIVWQPYPNGPSIGGCILHISSCAWYWLDCFVNKAPDPEGEPDIEYDKTLDQYIPHWPAPPKQPIEWYFDILQRRMAQCIELIRAHSDPKAVYPRSDYKVTYEWIVAHLIEHDSYHGGQAVLLHEIYKQIVKPR